MWWKQVWIFWDLRSKNCCFYLIRQEYEKYNKNNETYGKKNTQWKASKCVYIYINNYIYNLEQCHASVSKIFYLARFHIFEPYQRSKNKIKQFKNNEQQWQIMKNSKNQWKKYEKYNKSNETYRKKIHGMEGFQIYNLEPCHARVSKIFYLVRFRIFEPYQSSKSIEKQ